MSNCGKTRPNSCSKMASLDSTLSLDFSSISSGCSSWAVIWVAVSLLMMNRQIRTLNNDAQTSEVLSYQNCCVCSHHPLCTSWS